MFLLHNHMFNTQEVRVGLAIGAPIGLVLSYFMFNNIGWYHDYFMWTLQPGLLIPAAVIGGLVGYLTD